MPTVRITTEVNEALKAMAGREGEARSVTQIVDDTLRRLVQLPVEGDTTPAPAARARPASMAKPRARRQPQPEQLPTSPTKCLHPVGRRIGGVCMECGGKP